MALEIQGTVVEVGETTAVSDKFKKRELIIEYADNPQYPETIKFEAHQDKCDGLDELRAGDNVTVHFNLRGKAFVNKAGIKGYFNNLVVWKFSVNQTAGNVVPDYAKPVDISSSPESDDLPF